MFFTATESGCPIQKRRCYFSETFAAIGCAQYYKASGDETAWKLAEKFFNTTKMCFENPELNQPKFHISTKSLSPVMIMAATAGSMAECAPDSTSCRALAKKYTNEVLHGGFLSEEVNALLEHVSPKRPFHLPRMLMILHYTENGNMPDFFDNSAKNQSAQLTKNFVLRRTQNA